MARHGPILGGNGATGPRKLSGYLPDLREAIFDLKNQEMFKNAENQIFPGLGITGLGSGGAAGRILIFGPLPWIENKFGYQVNVKSHIL